MRSYAVPLAFALALALTSGACKRKAPDRAASVDAHVVARPPPAVVQLSPTLDGWRPVATLYTGTDPDVGVVLVHQLGSNRSEWAGLISRLQAGRAVTALAVDLRGHGESTSNPRSEAVTWESFGTDRDRWAETALDVLAAVQYLRASGVRRVVVVGSSIGASAAVLAATGTLGPRALPQGAEIDGLALLSPGLAYHGLALVEPMQRYRESHRPLLLLAGADDEQSAEAVPTLAAGNLPGIEAEVIAGAHEHGVSLCNAVPTRWDRVDAWIRRALGVATPGARPAALRDAGGEAAAPEAAVPETTVPETAPDR